MGKKTRNEIKNIFLYFFIIFAILFFNKNIIFSKIIFNNIFIYLIIFSIIYLLLKKLKKKLSIPISISILIFSFFIISNRVNIIDFNYNNYMENSLYKAQNEEYAYFYKNGFKLSDNIQYKIEEKYSKNFKKLLKNHINQNKGTILDYVIIPDLENNEVLFIKNSLSKTIKSDFILNNIDYEIKIEKDKKIILKELIKKESKFQNYKYIVKEYYKTNIENINIMKKISYELAKKRYTSCNDSEDYKYYDKLYSDLSKVDINFALTPNLTKIYCNNYKLIELKENYYLINKG